MKKGINIKKILIMTLIFTMVITVFTSVTSAVNIAYVGNDVLYDDNGNGIADRVYTFRDDGTISEFYEDTNGDGWCDIAESDTDGDGNPDTRMVDTDHDCFFDELWFKVNGTWCFVQYIYYPSGEMPQMPNTSIHHKKDGQDIRQYFFDELFMCINIDINLHLITCNGNLLSR